jgi:monothiol glutaredoxin
MSDAVNDRIAKLVSENKVLLFMKGTPYFPQCGFSSTAIAILERLGVAFETVDVLADPEIRQGIKAYSDWPTIPQLYIDGEFVGGSDIMMEMYQDGELADLLQKAGAAPSAA